MTFIVNTPVIRTTEQRWKVPASAVVDFEHTISKDSSVQLMLELADTKKGDLEFEKTLRQDGVEVLWAGRPYTMVSFTSGGSADKPTVTLSCIAQAQAELDGGGMDPAFSTQTNVPAWLDQTVSAIRDKGLVRILDTTLGDKQVEAESGTDTDDKETVWDMIHETAKRCGAWCWVSDTRFYFGKPAWLANTGDQNEWRFVWDYWASHSEQLTAKPKYTLDLSKKLWEGREELVLQLRDPEAIVSGQRLARNIRPGDRVSYKGQLAPQHETHGATWLVTEVSLPYSNVDPVEVTCWRPENPPEIVDENGTNGSGTAGVPDGPLGSGNWQGEQLEFAAQIVQEGQSEKLPMLAIQMGVCCAMGESSLRNLDYGDAAGPDSCGLFQQRDHYGPRSDRRTPKKAASMFYRDLKNTPYEDTYNNGGHSVVPSLSGPYYGPGNTATSASLAIHNEQRNSNPEYYVPFWDDAKIVVEACIKAGESAAAGGGDGKPPSGPLGDRMKRSINGMRGQYVDFDGAFQAQCADVGMRYANEMWGIGMVIADGRQYWHQSQIAPFCQAIPASGKPRYGDIASWSQYGNPDMTGGAGHIAIYISGDPASGGCMFLTQNPGNADIRWLSVQYLQGWMRPIR